jgi:glutamate synthase (NADPH/NADH) small chain
LPEPDTPVIQANVFIGKSTPCEAACTLNFNSEAVGIKSIEQAIIDRGWSEGWVKPVISKLQTGKRVAIVGSGPAGLAAGQQLARLGHSVVIFEKSNRIGGLLRYGIPDFKMEKYNIDRRIDQMEKEGVVFEKSVLVGKVSQKDAKNFAGKVLSPEALENDFDAVLIAGGAEQPRDLPVPGRQLSGVHFAMDFLPLQNMICAGDKLEHSLSAKGKHVVVIGGGDTGSDCVGTSNRQGAKSVTQFELMPQPPKEENKGLTWPYWPQKLRTSSSHQEGCERQFALATKEFMGENDKVTAVKTCSLIWENGKYSEVNGSEKIYPADLVLLSMGFVSPTQSLISDFQVEKDSRGNVKASDNGLDSYKTNRKNVFAAGDVRRGQSLVVWAIREGRKAAEAINEFLSTP